ncbi:MAG TPA: hypothetical protein VM146_12975 [Steroidobacteraceae bacterium]|nr:hypothetical protein [Steroidobacteraceae bacterium]
MHLLSLALFMAQWGMLAHATTHLKSDAHAAPTKTQVCGECLSFAPMQNAVGNAPAVLLGVRQSADLLLDVDAAAAVPPRTFDAFRSRAPPVSR